MSILRANVLPASAARTINEKLMAAGIPTIDRVVIAVSNKDHTTESGIIIPGSVKEEVPKRGTVVQVGEITEENRYFKDLLKIGAVITFGNYAGKKVEPQNIEVDGYDLMVLSLTEICYIEYL